MGRVAFYFAMISFGLFLLGMLTSGLFVMVKLVAGATGSLELGLLAGTIPLILLISFAFAWADGNP